MESQIESINTVECRVRVQIPWDEVSGRLNKKLSEIRRSVALPGFRRGKVPPQTIRRMYVGDAKAELTRDLFQETFQTAIVTHKTVPLTEPVLESTTFEEDQDFQYAARFEVAPVIAIESSDYEGVEVRRRPAIVEDEKVDAAIESKRAGLTEIRALAEDDKREEAREGDVWTVDIDGTFGTEPISRTDVSVEIGAETGEIIPGISAALADAKLTEVGGTRDLKFLPPQDRLKEEFQGLEAVLKVALREVREKIIPELDDEFARDTGDAETLDGLRTKLRENLLQDDKDNAEREARQRLVESLLERKEFEAAPSMINNEVVAQVQMFGRQLSQSGLTFAAIGSSEAQMAANVRPEATFRVKAFLLLDAIGKSQGIKIEAEELQKAVEEMAEEQGKNAARLRATMEKNKELLLLEAQMREERILDFLMEKAVVTEAPDPEPELEPEPENAETETETAAGANKKA